MYFKSLDVVLHYIDYVYLWIPSVGILRLAIYYENFHLAKH